MKFREQRGSLTDSMKTAVDLPDYAALIAHLRKLVPPWSMLPISAATVHIKPYGYDERIGWDTHIVTLDGYGVLGFTDSAGV